MPNGRFTAHFVMIFAVGLFGCGDVHLNSGNGLALNEPVPTNATLLAQGAIAENSDPAGLLGTAQVFQAQDGKTLLRLTGFNAKNAGTLYMFLETTTSPTFFTTIVRGISGQQNYRTARSASGEVFSRVVFRATGNVNSAELASASLRSPN